MSSSGKLYGFEEVSEHNKKDDCWLIISGKVYDVTSFVDDHPGGDEVLTSATKKDATDEFEDVGHSEDARELLNKFYVGEIDGSTLPKPIRDDPLSSATSTSTDSEGSGNLVKILQFFVPLLILGVAYYLRNYLKK